MVAAVLKPKETDSENAVDGGLRLGAVDGNDGPGVLSAGEASAGVAGAEGALEIHGGAEAFGTVVGEFGKKDACEKAQVTLAGGVAGGGCAEVLVGGEVERLGARLAESLGGKAERARAGCDCEDATDEVAFCRPEVEGGAIVLGEEGELGFAEVEEGTAVFKNEGVGVLGEKGLNGGGDVGGRLRGSFGDRATCCSGWHGVTVTTANG